MIQSGDQFNHQFEVNTTIFQGFQNLFLDKNPLHTDEAFAQSKGFAGQVMYGNILNGFLSYFVGELLPIKNVAILSQSITFRKPVYLNDILDFKAEVVHFSDAVNMADCTFVFSNQNQVKVAKGSIQIGILS